MALERVGLLWLRDELGDIMEELGDIMEELGGRMDKWRHTGGAGCIMEELGPNIVHYR